MFKVVHDNVDLTALVRDRLLSLSVTDLAGIASDQFSLAIDNRDLAVSIPKTGALLTVSMGYLGRVLYDLGQYTVDEIEASGLPRTLSLHGKAADMGAAFKSQRQRSWDKTTLGKIVRTIASEHSLEPKIAEKFEDIEIDHLDQAYESDLNVLTRLADQYGAVTKPAGGCLLFVERGAGVDANGDPLPTVDIVPTDLVEAGGWRTSVHDRQAYARVGAHWSDKRAAKTQYVYAGEGEPVMHIRNPYRSEKEALAGAESKLRQLQRGRTDLSMTLQGNPLICAEMPIALAGFDELSDGEWIVTRAEHVIDGSGMTTRIEAQRPDDLAAESDEPQKASKKKKAKKKAGAPIEPLPEDGEWRKWDDV